MLGEINSPLGLSNWEFINWLSFQRFCDCLDGKQLVAGNVMCVCVCVTEDASQVLYTVTTQWAKIPICHTNDRVHLSPYSFRVRAWQQKITVPVTSERTADIVAHTKTQIPAAVDLQISSHSYVFEHFLEYFKPCRKRRGEVQRTVCHPLRFRLEQVDSSSRYCHLIAVRTFMVHRGWTLMIPWL